jgi:hypothetical protein
MLQDAIVGMYFSNPGAPALVFVDSVKMKDSMFILLLAVRMRDKQWYLALIKPVF